MAVELTDSYSRESSVDLQAIRDNTGKLLQELLAIRDSNHVLRRSIQEVSATVGDVSDKMTDMHSRLDDVHALMILLVDKLNVGGHGDAVTQRVDVSPAPLHTAGRRLASHHGRRRAEVVDRLLPVR